MWTEATTFWLPNAFILPQHLSELEMGALYPLGLGHGITQTELTGTHQTTAQGGLLSAFQLPEHISPYSGSYPEDTFFRNAPIQAIGGVRISPPTFQNPS